MNAWRAAALSHAGVWDDVTGRTLMGHNEKPVEGPGKADAETGTKHKRKQETEKQRKREELDEELDEALEESFPASDPLSITQP